MTWSGIMRGYLTYYHCYHQRRFSVFNKAVPLNTLISQVNGRDPF